MKTKKETEIKYSVSFLPTDCNIIGVEDNNLYIRFDDASKTDSISNTNHEVTVIVQIKQKKFNEILESYIERKRDFCKRYGHFCGAFGHSYSKKCKEIGSIKVPFCEYDIITHKTVPVISVTEWSEPDMEHG